MSKEVMKLSVGGVRYDTTLATLQRDGESMLATMFNGRWDLPVTDDGCTFIDRDGHLFGFILNYLRGCVTLPSDRYTMDRLYEEACYFNLIGLMDIINKHDMNSRKFVLKYEINSLCTDSILPIICLRREKNSILALVVGELYNQFSRSRTGNLNVPASAIDCYLQKIPVTNLSINKFFRDIEQGSIYDLQLGMRPSIVTKRFLNASAYRAIAKYLKTGKLLIRLNKTSFDKALAEDKCAMLYSDAIPFYSWSDIINQILRPMVIYYAECFGFSALLTQLLKV